jgi:hypothetical protein
MVVPFQREIKKRAGLEGGKSHFRHVKLKEAVGHPSSTWVRIGGRKRANATRVQIQCAEREVNENKYTPEANTELLSASVSSLTK